MIDLAEAVRGGEGWIVEEDRPANIKLGPAAESETDIVLVFDGGSKGNPGKGYGSFAYKGRVVRWPVRITFPGKQTTNNQAEYMALIGGLRAVLADLAYLDQDPSAMRLKVLSDSQLLVQQINGRWKVKNPGLRVRRDEVQQLLAQFGSTAVDWHPRAMSVRILGH